MNLEGLDLSKLDLTGINFRFCNLKDVNFAGANVTGANFERACLVGAVFDVSCAAAAAGIAFEMRYDKGEFRNFFALSQDPCSRSHKSRAVLLSFPLPCQAFCSRAVGGQSYRDR